MRNTVAPLERRPARPDPVGVGVLQQLDATVRREDQPAALDEPYQFSSFSSKVPENQREECRYRKPQKVNGKCADTKKMLQMSIVPMLPMALQSIGSTSETCSRPSVGW